MNLLEQLRGMTVVVADTGDIEAIAQYRPQDTTTNPSLLYKAAQMSQYQHIVKDAVEFAQSTEDDSEAQLDACLDKLAMGFGKESFRSSPVGSRPRSMRTCRSTPRRPSPRPTG